MWANHDANYLWDKRNSDNVNCTIWNGAVDYNQFMIIGRRWIDMYFKKDNYYKIDGKPVVTNNTPENFQKALEEAKKYADENNVSLITVNSWNEWTETSYLEPDNLYGYGYLEAIKNVFKK